MPDATAGTARIRTGDGGRAEPVLTGEARSQGAASGTLVEIATAPDPEPNWAVGRRGFGAGPFEVAEPWALLLSVRD